MEPSCPFEDKKKNRELGESNASIMSQRVSTVLTGAPRKGFSLEYTRKFVITNKDKEIHSGIVRYHRDRVFLASSKNNREPKREVRLNNSMIAMKNKSDVMTSAVVTDMELDMTDTKAVTHVIMKTADVNASATFILINSSPQNVK